MYDLIVIGAGSGGLTAVDFANHLGLKVALIEKNKIGGDCTWTGCVPSKALIHVSKTVQAARDAAQFGLSIAAEPIDMTRVKAYVQQTIQDIYKEESPEKIEAKGVDVYLGAATFIDEGRVQVGSEVLIAKKYIVGTGASPIIPEIPGLDDVAYVTYEQLFENERLPEHLLILGAGPIGLEMGQAYRRLGAKVTIIAPAMLPKAEPEAVQEIQAVLAAEDIRVHRRNGHGRAPTWGTNFIAGSTRSERRRL